MYTSLFSTLTPTPPTLRTYTNITYFSGLNGLLHTYTSSNLRPTTLHTATYGLTIHI
jgi:hypothetical protein